MVERLPYTQNVGGSSPSRPTKNLMQDDQPALGNDGGFFVVQRLTLKLWLNKRMKPSVALQVHRELIRTVVERYRAKNPRVFGSVLHGVDKEGSDLDLLVDPAQGATLFDLGAIQIELEERLGVPVDVLVPKDLPLQFRDLVLSEALPV